MLSSFISEHTAALSLETIKAEDRDDSEFSDRVREEDIGAVSDCYTDVTTGAVEEELAEVGVVPELVLFLLFSASSLQFIDLCGLLGKPFCLHLEQICK